MNSPRGFTLPEVLVALAITGIVLLVAWSFARSNLITYQQTMQLIEHAQLERAAADVVIQEIGLAGHGDGILGSLSGPAISVTTGGASDTVTVNYVEERWLAEPLVRSISFTQGKDSTGQPNLYRQEAGATRQPAVQEVTGFRVAAFIDESGTRQLPGGPWPARITGLLIELSFTWEHSRLVYVDFGVPRELAGP